MLPTFSPNHPVFVGQDTGRIPPGWLKRTSAKRRRDFCRKNHTAAKCLMFAAKLVNITPITKVYGRNIYVEWRFQTKFGKFSSS